MALEPLAFKRTRALAGAKSQMQGVYRPTRLRGSLWDWRRVSRGRSPTPGWAFLALAGVFSD
jgi:hypothetical protein